MALEGNLTSFKIEEILQLIAVQQKTGMLSANASDKSAVLFFRDGKIVSTRDRRSKTRDPFREYLTRYGVLGREELVRITQISSQSKLDLLDILTSEGFFDEKTLQRHWRNHIQESLHDVLTWDQCSYKFISGDEIISGVKSLPAVVPDYVPDARQVLADLEATHREVAQLMRSLSSAEVNTIRFPDLFNPRFSHSLGVGMLIIAAHERRHLWQAEQARTALTGAAAS